MTNKKVLFLFIIIILFLSLFFETVIAADGSGTCSLSPSQVFENTDTTLTFVFIAAETMDGGSIAIEVPGGWSAPQGVSGTAGYAVATSTGAIGALTFSSQTITVPITALANTQTITVVYGSGGSNSSARVPLTVGRGGSYPMTVSSKTSSGGTLTAISSLPSIVVVVRPEIDSTAPVTALTAPINEEIIENSSYTITGTAVDTGGSTPAWVKVGIDDVWHEADVVGQSFSTWEYEWTDITEGIYTIQTKSADWIGNNETPGEGITVTVSFEAPVEEEEEIPEEEVSEEEVEEEEIPEEEVEEKPISEMTIEELKAEITEIRQQIIELLSQLIQFITSQIAQF